MNEASASAARTLQLPDAAYDKETDEDFAHLADALAPGYDASDPQSSVPVFALGLQRSVGHVPRAMLPAALLLRRASSRQWDARFEPNFRVIVVDLRSGALRQCNPLDVDDAEYDPSRSGPPPSELDRLATLHGYRRFGIPALFGDSWSSPGYAVTALYHDWASNTVVVEGHAVPEPDRQPTRAASTFLAPSAIADTAAPAGLTIALPLTPAADGAIALRGTVQAKKSSLTLAPTTQGPDSRVMVATVLLVGLDDPYLRRLELIVPVVAYGDTVRGAFAFDLARRPEAASLAGHFQVYLVSGRTVSKPASLTVAAR